MHRASEYLQSINKTGLGSVLSPIERQLLESCLHDDACSYYQSSLMSFIDALSSIPEGFYSWATVKSYYSVFYALRARLALAGQCVFYDGTKGRLLGTSAASFVSNVNTPSTHKTVLSRFSSLFPNDFFLTQEIDDESPLLWLVGKREEANYKQARFSEPFAPNHLNYAATTDVRQMLNAYLSEDLYVHSKEHAIVAFPFRLLIDLRKRLSNQGLQPLGQSEIDFLSRHIMDRTGVITAANSLLI